MWKPIAEFEDVGPIRQFDLWLTVRRSPRSMGLGDAWRVPDAYYKDGKWWHVQNAESKELVSDYITHFMDRPTGPNSASFTKGTVSVPKHYDSMTLMKPSRRVSGMIVYLDGTLDQEILNTMARCISDDEMIGELSDMNRLLYRLSERGYELVKVDKQT